MNTLAESVTERAAPDAEELAGRSYAEYATAMLRDRLIVLNIPPGAPINDEQIGRELGIGRTPVREALKRLEAEHLVAVYPRRGTFAAPVDITDLASITEMRALLEPLAASRAARFASTPKRESMRDLAARLTALDTRAVSPIALMRHDLEVHRSIYAANGNSHLEEDLIKYDNLATRIWCLVLDRLPDVAAHVSEHVELLNAIVDGNAERAADLALTHVTGFEGLIRSVI
ncbi:GntR family transcriptional regulator [Microbacterium trichothecenolyticum]|uniref:GntR family transcriptional regulator n=1 Tax=Microbacterium ureisolvens TaxID=2781186 RepID=A0ABS7I194_9MICO|nr:MULTISPECIES: GntR family transcriptional regulator [Microbacterium]MBW9111441.1 GntR family transcriptional regulator [Microbacterium ureisolvens]MBW9121689.1 GntR family transcriptional regulator [Microbacterium trichothecenolyticum]